MRIRSIQLASWATAAGLILAACGGSASGTASPAASSPAPASSAAASKPAASSAASAKLAASSAASTKPAVSGSASAKAAASGSGGAGAATGTPYNVGLLTSLTGPYAILGTPQSDAIKLEAKKLNAAGGINGHPINLLIEDDQSDPNKGVVAIKRIIDQKPIAELGPIFSSTSLAVEPLEEQAKLPTMTTAADEAQVNPVRKYVFMDAPRTTIMAPGLLSYLKATKVQKIAVIHDPSAYGAGGPKALKENASKYGIDIVEEETYNLTDTDMTAQLTKIKNNSQVQAVIEWGSGPAPVIVTKEFKSLGFKIPLVLSAAEADASFIKAAGDAAEGVIMDTNKLQVFDYLLPDDPSRKLLADFIPSYKQAVNKEPNEFSSNGYDAFHMMVNAIKAANSTDADKIQAELEKTKFDGADGSYQYSAKDHAGMTANALAMVAVKGGKLVPIKPNCDGCFDTTVTKG